MGFINTDSSSLGKIKKGHSDPQGVKYCRCVSLAHCRLHRLSHTIYWKSPISILDTSGYEI